jgi:hypothetical protein
MTPGSTKAWSPEGWLSGGLDGATLLVAEVRAPNPSDTPSRWRNPWTNRS